MDRERIVGYSREEQLQTAIAINREKFSKIYSLTLLLCGISRKVAHCSEGSRKCWLDLMAIWKDHSGELKCEDVFFAALYHIQWRRHHHSIKSKQLKRLVILVEQEILADSYAFKIWRTTNDFKNAFDRVVNPVRSDVVHRRGWHSCRFRKYIYSRTFSLVIYKGKVPDSKLMYMGRHDINRARTAVELIEYYNWFEEIICCLLPEAANWEAEWSKENYIMQRMLAVHGVDFTSNYEDFDRLIDAVGRIINHQSYTKELLSVENFTFSMAEVIWGQEAVKKIQSYFTLVCRNHRRWENATRVRDTTSAYNRNDILASWVYKQLEAWRVSKDARLTRNSLKRLLDFGLGI